MRPDPAVTRPTTGRRRRRQCGQAMVEGALISIAFITCLVAILELSRYILFLQFFTERARAGARYAAVSNYDVGTIKNWIAYNSAIAPTTTNYGAAPGLFGITPAMINVGRFNQGSDTDRLEISINNYPVSLVVPVLPPKWTLKPFRVILTAESLGATN